MVFVAVVLIVLVFLAAVHARLKQSEAPSGRPESQARQPETRPSERPRPSAQEDLGSPRSASPSG